MNNNASADHAVNEIKGLQHQLISAYCVREGLDRG